MKQLRGTALAIVAVTLLSPAAVAQGPDARVLPRGMVELRVQGVYTRFDDRFGPGGTEPLGSGFSALIAEPAGRLAAAVTDSARTRLEGFYARTQAATGGDAPLDLEPGTPRAALSADFRDVPATLAFGLTPRITVEVTARLQRRGTVVRGLTLDGATIGIDPAPDRNLEILLRADSVYGQTFGRYLPLRGSAAGQELQRRVLELAGDTLTLPTAAVPVLALLDDVPRAPLDSAAALMLRAQSGRTNYFLGDTELGVRFQLARGPDAWSSGPVDSTFARGFRATVGGRVRIPTGSREAVLFPLQFAPEGGHWGFGGDAAADWFLSRRWWVTAAADAQVLFPTDVQRLAFAADVPFPDTTQVRTLRREAGARFGASVTPRYRLTREISFAGQYAFRHAGAVTLSADEPAVLLGPIETLDARTAHALGLGMSYSTLAAYRAGESPFPAEFSLLYRRVVTGSGFQPAASSVELTARLFTRIFGGAARVPAPPPAPAAPAAATDTIPPTGESE